MRSKKAFTLIELLAVIVILAVIALIATPIVLNIIGKAKKSAFLDSAYGIIKSGENYYAERLLNGTGMIEDQIFLFDEGKPEGLKYSGTTPNGGTITISKEGKVGIAIYNESWCVTKSKDTSEVNITKYEEGKCLIPDTAKDPMITLKGNEEDQIGKGQTYVDPGATARTVDGTPLSYQTEITKNGEKVSSIDTSKVGDIYKITYTAESNGKKASVNRTVTVIDMTPVISFTEVNPNYVKSQNVAIIVSAIRPNTIDKFIYQIDEGEEVEVSGTNKVITLNESGEHKIKVTVRDNKGNEATKTSNVYKIDATGPTITLNPETVTLKVNEVASYNLYTGVSIKDNVDGDIVANEENVKTTGELKAEVGTHNVTYEVSDKLGNKTSKVRTFNVVEAEGPILNFSSISSNDKWVKAQNITVTATDNSNLASFTYEVFKNGTSQGVQNVTVSGKSATATVSLSSDGTYTIKLKATDQYGSSNETTSGTYKIDVTKPTISMNNVTIYDNQASSYNLMTGVTVNDNSGVAPTVKTSGNITSTPKAYTITYTVTDEAGNVTTANRTITVKSSLPTVADKVAQSPETNTNDPGGNRRYVGANPKNYVRFNNELWRVIGIFNGQAKIIRNDFYSTGKAWDTNNENNWTIASLKIELNVIYLNGIDATSKSYIDQSHVWNLGGYGSDYTTSGTRANFYNKERGTSGYPTTWTGAIGLMYPSDWAYASSSTQSYCNSLALASWSGSSYADCRNNSWLNTASYFQWTLTPNIDGTNNVFNVTTSGGIGWSNAEYARGLRPVLYLKSDVKVKSGTGTSADPFILSM